MIYIIVIALAGMVLGTPISHYTAYIINKSPDCPKAITHKIFSVRNLIICVINAVVWLSIYLMYGACALTIIYMIAGSALLALSVVDFAIYEIPIQFNIILLILGIIVLVLDLQRWYVYLIGSVLVSGIFLLLLLATKGKGMGGGDVKLMFTCGLILGWQKIFFVMFFGALIGAVVHLSVMKITKKNSTLSFGPYLSFATVLMMLFGNQVIDWYIKTFLTINQ